LLQHNADDFMQYISHTEKARKQDIKNEIYQEKLKDFAKEDETPV